MLNNSSMRMTSQLMAIALSASTMPTLFSAELEVPDFTPENLATEVLTVKELSKARQLDLLNKTIGTTFSGLGKQKTIIEERYPEFMLPPSCQEKFDELSEKTASIYEQMAKQDAEDAIKEALATVKEMEALRKELETLEGAFATVEEIKAKMASEEVTEEQVEEFREIYLQTQLGVTNWNAVNQLASNFEIDSKATQELATNEQSADMGTVVLSLGGVIGIVVVLALFAESRGYF